MDLYFLDDGSLIIDTSKSIKLISPNNFEIKRTIGCNYLSNLSGKEAYDLLGGQSILLDPNDLSSNTKREESVGTGDKKLA